MMVKYVHFSTWITTFSMLLPVFPQFAVLAQ